MKYLVPFRVLLVGLAVLSSGCYCQKGTYDRDSERLRKIYAYIMADSAAAEYAMGSSRPLDFGFAKQSRVDICGMAVVNTLIEFQRNGRQSSDSLERSVMEAELARVESDGMRVPVGVPRGYQVQEKSAFVAHVVPYAEGIYIVELFENPTDEELPTDQLRGHWGLCYVFEFRNCAVNRVKGGLVMYN